MQSRQEPSGRCAAQRLQEEEEEEEEAVFIRRRRLSYFAMKITGEDPVKNNKERSGSSMFGHVRESGGEWGGKGGDVIKMCRYQGHEGGSLMIYPTISGLYISPRSGERYI